VGVKNVTLSAEERLFRQWLAELTAETARKDGYDDLMRRLGHARSGGRFSRSEMNAR
jgi:hypothetical protein